MKNIKPNPMKLKKENVLWKWEENCMKLLRNKVQI